MPFLNNKIQRIYMVFSWHIYGFGCFIIMFNGKSLGMISIEWLKHEYTIESTVEQKVTDSYRHCVFRVSIKKIEI
jgi:hypothetical protein